MAEKNPKDQLKNSLKAAKESIKNKEFREALKHCKNVLKIDKTNYNALVFIGLCATEMEQYDQGRAAYKKAADQKPDQMLAWQGLCSLYEKVDNEEWRQELPSIYGKIMKANESDKTKWVEVCLKLADFQISFGRTTEVVACLNEVETKFELQSDELLQRWKKVMKLLEQQVLESASDTQLLNEAEQVHKKILDFDIKLDVNAENDEISYIQFLCRCLKKQTEVTSEQDMLKRIKEQLHDIRSRYPASREALEILCQLYLETKTGMSDITAVETFNQLFTEDSSSSLALIGLGWIAHSNRQFTKALEFLNKAIEKSISNPLAYLLLAKTHMVFHNSNDSLTIIKQGIRHTDNLLTASFRSYLVKEFRITRAECLISVKMAKEAIGIIKKALELESDDVNCLGKLAEAYIANEEHSKAVEISDAILQKDSTSHIGLALKAQISIHEGKLYDAELRLQEAIEHCNDIAHYHFLLGKVYWHLSKENSELVSKSHSALLKSAKLDPYSAETFLYLGHYYRNAAKDRRKAQKCYQKSYALDSTYEDAAIALSEICTELGDEEEALRIYESVTNEFGAGRAKWAWLRKGLMQLRKGEIDLAVMSLQCALRADPSDRHCWECLGEAYVTRGSYTAALKSFQRALELEPSSLYCRFQLASIKQLLHVYSEAIQGYQDILNDKSDYIPALKGLAEAHLRLECHSLANNFDGRAVDHATEVLSAVSRALLKRPDLCCLWKIIGDACFALHVLPEQTLKLKIPDSLSKLVNLSLKDNVVVKETILELSWRAFAVALKLDDSSASLWHDLGISMFHFGELVGGQTGKEKVLQSIQFVKKSIGLEANNHKHWNTLGLMTSCSGPFLTCCGHNVEDVADPELSQHAFIKAVELEPKSAEAWTNLGVLYLKYNKKEVAHEAFKKAQAADPSYTPAWIGQACIAEIIGDADSMDLFRHSTELSSQNEGNLGYAHWVCASLQKLPLSALKGYTKPVADLRHLPLDCRKVVLNASVAVRKYTERLPKNPCAFNMLGILLEQEDLYKESTVAYSRGEQLLKNSDGNVENLNKIIGNHARVLCLAGKYDKAIEKYQQIKPLNRLEDICNLALAYFLNGQMADSLNAYQQGLSLATDGNDKSCILAAIGMVAYASGDEALAKSMLFKSSQTTSPSEHGLMALTSLGLLTSDGTLATAAIVELIKHSSLGSEHFQVGLSTLTAALYLLQGKLKPARNCLQKAIKRHPSSVKLWNNLARFLFERTSTTIQLAGHCSVVSSRIESSVTAASILTATTLASPHFSAKKSDLMEKKTEIRNAQKMVHSHPERCESWILLAAAVRSHNLICNSGKQHDGQLAMKTSRLALIKAEQQIADLQNTKQMEIEKRVAANINHAISLYFWTVKELIICQINNDCIENAQMLCQNAVEFFNESPQMASDIEFLKSVTEVYAAIKAPEDRDSQIESLLSSLSSQCSADASALWKWKVAAVVHKQIRKPVAAEYFYRQCVQLGTEQDLGSSRFVSLIQLVSLSIHCSAKGLGDRWLTLAREAISEALKLSPENEVAILLNAIIYHQEGKTKKFNNTILWISPPADGSLLKEIVEKWKQHLN